jgi:serine/threonine protein phosphatase PrpC
MTEAISLTIKNKNEDSYNFISGDDNDLLIIADGISSLKNSAETSNFTTKFIKENYENGLNLSKIFSIIKDELLNYAQRENLNPKEMGTTIICIERIKTKINIYWLGNGAIFILQPEHLHIKYRPLVNIISPDAIFNNLYKHLTPLYNFKPNFISIELNPPPLIIACSDGIFSQESATIAEDSNKKLWQKYPEEINSLVDDLINGIKNENLDLKKILNEFKDNIINQIEDDATIGVIISNEFIEKTKNLKI